MNEAIFHLSAKAIVHNPAGKILLLKSNPLFVKSTARISFWDLPGGRVKRGGTIEDTLKREVSEETGITNLVSFQPFSCFVMPVRIQENGTDFGLIFSVYLCKVNEISEVRLSKEHIEASWCAVSEAACLLGDMYPKEFIEKLTTIVY